MVLEDTAAARQKGPMRRLMLVLALLALWRSHCFGLLGGAEAAVVKRAASPSSEEMGWGGWPKVTALKSEEG